ncbi:MAG: 3-oxoacyl-ACP reductase [Caulobacteraceae bacterium]|nr:3-oxoacyl-ACP reductase [Caulobacteraceae bacterium]
MTETRLAVVTAGESNLGAPIVLALARAGWDVAFTYVGGPGRAKAVEDQVDALGVRALSVECDAGYKDQVDAFYERVQTWAGAPDLLVNNAGIQTWSSLLDLAESDWDAVIRTNLKGCFLNTQAAARRMIAARKGGAIINMGSGCNKLAFPKLVDYTASKGGIEQFTKVSAVELGPYGIRVNCVAPGAVETERTKTEAGDYAGDWSKITPLRRVGMPEDIAQLVVTLAQPNLSFISGQTINSDGGVFSMASWPYPLDNPQ